MALFVPWSLTINGRTVTEKWNPYVESLECSGHAGGQADSAVIRLDDTGGQVMLPPKGSRIEIRIMGRLRFKGFADDTESVGSRGGGRTLEVHCTGYDKSGKAKQKLNVSKDDCTLQEFLDEVAKKAGIKTVKVSEELGKIKRAFWSTRGRNFLQLGQALADELGGTFKLRADDAVLAMRGAGMVPGGGSTPSIVARVGDNMIEWRVRPFEGRPRYAKARVRRYDRGKAKHVVDDVEIGPLVGGVIDEFGEARPDEESSKRAGQGLKTKSEREGGSGSVTILIEPDAEVEGTCTLVGCRPGVDGPYRIESWRDKVERNGAETTLEIKQPQGDAGKDSRAK